MCNQQTANRAAYDSDLSDQEWGIIAPYIPAAKSGGHPRTTNIREVVNAIFYMLRAGCASRLLPQDFPPDRRSMATFGTGYKAVSGNNSMPSYAKPVVSWWAVKGHPAQALLIVNR